MIRVTFLYPNNPGSHFNSDYYINVHMPLSIRLLQPALKGVSAEIGVSSAMPDQPPLMRQSRHSHLSPYRLSLTL
jgi:hypothetical protein